MSIISKCMVWTAGLVTLFSLANTPFGQGAAAQEKSQEIAAQEGPPNKEKQKPIHILVPSITGNEKDHIVPRLQNLKFNVRLVNWKTVDPDRLEIIDVIFLPTQWAESPGRYQHFESKKKAFHDFVKRGGGLLVCQPNPLHAPQNMCTPTLLPYPITFKNWYDKSDTTRVNLDPNHFITEDLPGNDMPFPADPMIKVDPRYTILAKQRNPASPSLAVCQFGDGRVVVQTANENYGAIVELGDEILRRMVVWAAGREPAVFKKK